MTNIRKKLAGKATKLAQDKPKQDDHPANLNDCREGSYYQLDIDLIKPDPEQPEQSFDMGALEELANSIKQTRLYQPVVVRKDERGEIILVAGKRRLRAAKMAGLEQIPAIFTLGNPLEISIIENMQRENLKPVEEAEALGRMIEQHGYTEKELAAALGKAPTRIAEAIKLNRLPETIKDECRQENKYPRQLLAEIAAQDTPEAMMSLFNRAKQGNFMSAEVGIPMTGSQTQSTELEPAKIARDEDVSLPPFLPNGDIEKSEQNRQTQLLLELQNLINIIDELILK